MKTSISMLIRSEEFGNLDGHYLEDLIEGYVTASVTGRETLSTTLVSESVGNRDGAIYRTKKYSPRNLVVSFIIEGDSTTDLLEKLEMLNEYLDIEEAQYTFDDEPDRYYVGTPSGSPKFTISAPGGSDTCAASGSFTIVCSDPFKYSNEYYQYRFNTEAVIELEDEDQPNREFNTRAVSFDYDGTYPAFPQFTVNMANCENVYRDDEGEPLVVDYISEYADKYNGDENAGLANDDTACSYLAILDDKGHVLQFGDADVSSPKTFDDTQVLENQIFTTKAAWSTTTMGKWRQSEVPNGVLPANHTVRSAGSSAFSTALAAYNTPQGLSASANTKLINLFSKKKKSTNTSGGHVYYMVSCAITGRKETSATFKMVITATKASSVTIASKKSLTATLTTKEGYAVNPSSKVIVKSGWKKGSTKKTVTIATVTVSGISATTRDITFRLGVSSTAKNSVGALARQTCLTYNIPTYKLPADTAYYLKGNQATTSSSNWVGVAMTRYIPADAAGNFGATNFEATAQVVFACGKDLLDKQQCGDQICYLIGGTNGTGTSITNPYVVAGIRLVDDSKVSKNGTVEYKRMTLKDGATQTTTCKTVKNVNYNYSRTQKKKTVNNHMRTLYIAKDAEKLYFSVSGSGSSNCTIKFSSLSEAEAERIKNAKVYGVVFGAFRHSTRPYLEWNGIRSFEFKKLECDTIAEVEKPFTAGSAVTIDVASAKMAINGVETPRLGAIGNNWESMTLTKGTNSFIAACSALDKGEEPYIYKKCRGLAYIPCSDTDFDEDNIGTYYIPTEDTDTYPDGYTIYTAEEELTAESFESIYSSLYRKDWVDPYSSDTVYYNAAHEPLSGVSKSAYEAAPYNYYIRVNAVPVFTIGFREVYI